LDNRRCTLRLPLRILDRKGYRQKWSGRVKQFKAKAARLNIVMRHPIARLM
jgi:hypothetical protein